MQNLLIITNIECVLAISVYLFLFIIFLAFIAFLFKQEQRSLQKIIGGFGVFVVAILSQDRQVMTLSLFIGGLIIASEEFMKTLAAIFRAESSDIPKILMEKATEKEKIEKEIKEKEEDPGEEKLEEKKKPEKEEKPLIQKAKEVKKKTSFKKRLQVEREVEEITNNYLSHIFGDRYSKNMKFKSEYGDIVVDGIIKKSYSSEVSKIVEIKYVRNERERLLHYYARKIAERIRFRVINIPILIIFVYENKLTKKRVTDLHNNFVGKYKDISVGFLNFDKEKKKVEQALISQEIFN